MIDTIASFLGSQKIVDEAHGKTGKGTEKAEDNKTNTPLNGSKAIDSEGDFSDSRETIHGNTEETYKEGSSGLSPSPSSMEDID